MIEFLLGIPAKLKLVKTDTDSIKSSATDIINRVTNANTNIDTLIARVGLPSNTTVVADLTTLKTKIGSPVSSISADIASVNTKLGTPVLSVSTDIASVKSDISLISSKIGSTVSLTIDISNAKGVIDTINTRIGLPVSSVSADIAAVKGDIAAVSNKIGTTSSLALDVSVINGKIGNTASLATDISNAKSVIDTINGKIASTLTADIATIKSDAGTAVTRANSIIADIRTNATTSNLGIHIKNENAIGKRQYVLTSGVSEEIAISAISSLIKVDDILYFTLIGGGGGGGAAKGSDFRGAGGGGSGGVIYKIPYKVTDTSLTIAYKIGTGGAGGNSITGDGGNGVNTNITLPDSRYFVARGGSKGLRNESVLQAAAVSGTTNVPVPFNLVSDGGVGNNTVNGGLGGNTAYWGNSSTAGTADTPSASSSVGYGCGGSGGGKSSNANTWGNGANGQPGCIIIEY